MRLNSDSAISIRPVEMGDRDEWWRMRRTLFPDSSSGEIDDWFRSFEDGGTPTVGAAVFVIERREGRLGGFVEIGVRDYADGCSTSPVAYLEAWYVDPDLRQRGLGRQLASAAEEWAVHQGFREIASDTQLENDVGLTAHLAIGYEEVERQICFKKRL